MNIDYIHHDTRTDEPLQIQIKTLTKWQDPTIEEKDKEIERLNNIIDELEKWLKDYKIQLKKYDCNSTIGVINCILNKLKSLKEGK